MNKKETKNTVKPHTEAKLKFYIHYLERYLPILVKTLHVDKINIYDMFCGQAIYDDGKESGAIRAFHKIKEVQENNADNDTEITLTLNDLDKRRINNIKIWIKQQTKTFETYVLNEDATNLIPKLIKDIDTQGNKVRNLVFIDPYGYKEIDKNLIKDLMKNGRTEIILFLPINQMNRFKNETMGNDVKKYFLPLKKFIEQFQINIEDTNDLSLIKKIEKALSFDDSNYSTSYHIKNQQGKYYALFFMASHILGLQKTLEVKWKLDEQQGSGFNDTNQQDMFLEVEKTLELEKILKHYIQESKNNNELYECTLKQGFLPKHTNEILKKLKQNNHIQVEYFLGVKRGYHINYKNYKKNVIKVKITHDH